MRTFLFLAALLASCKPTDKTDDTSAPGDTAESADSDTADTGSTPNPEDLNGDGLPDLVLAGYRLDFESADFVTPTRIFMGTGSGFDAAPSVEVEGTGVRDLLVSDLDMDGWKDLYLRIAPELYLKRLVVGGLEKVFEINRNFRNEGISTRHNPEFTMVEFYEAYRDYRYLMDFVEQMLRDVATQTLGHAVVPYQGQMIDLSRPFDRLTALEATVKYNPELAGQPLDDRDFVVEELKRRKIAFRPKDDLGGLQLTLFEETTEHKLIQPTYIIDYPVETSPLARASDSRPGITERFELYIAGREVANGFSELNDPEDQEARFDAQVAAKEAGDEEAMFKDKDYIRALEHGLPPTAGCGIGIDRLVMLLTDAASIRDVILFPQLRRED
jgi:lysyl-tRNA synthetase class 2